MDKKFNYVYTAPTVEERKEIDSIRRQYAEEEKGEESKLDRLRKLDARVKNVANCVGIVLGVVGLLIFGLGITMILEWSLLWGGIPVAILGGGVMAIAYPTYKRALRRGKKKYGEEILRLSEELLSE